MFATIKAALGVQRVVDLRAAIGRLAKRFKKRAQLFRAISPGDSGGERRRIPDSQPSLDDNTRRIRDFYRRRDSARSDIMKCLEWILFRGAQEAKAMENKDDATTSRSMSGQNSFARFPKQEFTIPRVSKFTESKAIHPETLAPYLFYANSHYTRNLIYKCELFEVLAICWNVGQVSRIHNHRGPELLDGDAHRPATRAEFSRRKSRCGAWQLANSFPRFLRLWTRPIPPSSARRACASGAESSGVQAAPATSIHIYSYPYASLRSVFDG